MNTISGLHSFSLDVMTGLSSQQVIGKIFRFSYHKDHLMHFRHNIVSPIVNFKSHWLELIPSVNFFMTCNWDWHVSGPTFWFSIHTSSRDIKSFVRYLHMQRQLHLLTIWECWKEKLRYTIVFSTAILCHTDAAAAAYVWTFLLSCGNTTPFFCKQRG